MFYSVNSYSSSQNRKGVSGLVSGMDTDEMVKGMTMGTQNKITKQLQKKQLTVWRQDAYREVTKSINDFQNKYFSYSAGKNNILSSNFFQNGKITTDSSFVRASGSLSAAKNVQIKDIKDLATTASMTTDKNISKGDITGNRLHEGWYSSNVSGNVFNLNVDGKDVGVRLSTSFEFNKDTSTDAKARFKQLETALNDALKASGIGDKVSASFTADGKFKLEGKTNAETGETSTVKMSDNKVNDTNVRAQELYKALDLENLVSSGSGVVSKGEINTDDFVKHTTLQAELVGKSISFTFNGVSKKITFNDSEKSQFDTPDKLVTYLNTKLDSTFGKNASGAANISVTRDSTGGMTFKAGDKFDVMSVSSSDSKLLTEHGALGITSGTSNRVPWNKSIKDISGQLKDSFGTPDADGNYTLTINDVAIKVNQDDTLNAALNKINGSDAGVTLTYSTTSDSFSIVAKESGTMGKIKITENDFSKALFGSAKADPTDPTDTGNFTNNAIGTNANLTVSFDGGKTFQDIERTSNSITLDGLTIELLKKADGVADENITFNVETNNDEIVDKMKEFLKDYNEMIKGMSDKLTEAPDRKFDYSPLTQEQKDDMTEDEVKTWEKKAKQGIMYGDPYLSKILTDLRGGAFSKVDGVDIGLSSIGITTGAWEDNGKLVMDPTGEATFRRMLTESPEKIERLFNHKAGDPYIRPGKPDYDANDLKNSGIGYKLDVAFNYFAGTTGGNGILVAMAGKATDSKGQDSLSVAIENIDKQLEKLRKTLQAEEERYYKQFANMETYLSQMNNQSSWLTQQFSSQ